MKIRKWMYLFGVPILLGNFIVMSYLFLNAYFNPLKMHGIKINVLGEADIEFIMVLISIPIVIYLFVDFCKTFPNVWWSNVDEETESGV